ncbi:MAG: hypothetical protein LBQ41_02325 [Candidatus Ancillula sp.]|jgi:hypothetical protein|nr:hypothetical protein [Candidatus Ancillula sp.]
MSSNVLVAGVDTSTQSELGEGFRRGKSTRLDTFARIDEYFKSVKSRDVNDPEFDVKEEVAKARWEKYASLT